jgi:hypothetical protein
MAAPRRALAEHGFTLDRPRLKPKTIAIGVCGKHLESNDLARVPRSEISSLRMRKVLR